MVVNLKTNRTTLFFDIETGGLWASPGESILGQRRQGVAEPTPKSSSILSLSYKVNEEAGSLYSRPVTNSWVSQFSQENILPQLAGKVTQTEESTIRGFIDILRQHPSADIAGYNIQGFDLGFLEKRAGRYGLGKEFQQVLQGRTIKDVGFMARDQIMESISDHIYSGTFKEQLGGKTFTARELEYFGPGGRQKNRRNPLIPYAEQDPAFRTLSQAEAYVSGGYQGQVRGWKLAPIFKQYSEWANLPAEQKSLVTAAHESLADVKMTEILHRGIESGRFREFTKTTGFAHTWLQDSLGSTPPSQAGAYFTPPPPTATGRIRAATTSTLNQARKVGRSSFLRLPTDPLPGGAGKWAAFIAGAGLTAAAIAGYLSFSGSDDEYNTIEALRHDGIASDLRRDITEFGSGWRGTSVQIDPEILQFREEVIENDKARKNLQEELDRRQAIANESIGSLLPSDLLKVNTDTIEGIKNRNRALRAVNLKNFHLNAEDADSLVLQRKGLLNRLFGKDILIRLAGIDAPETDAHGEDPLDFIRKWQSQAGGEEATSRLQDLIESGDLNLFVRTTDKSYGRYLGVLADEDGTNINIQLTREGMVSALPFGPASEDLVDRKEVALAEEQAQAQNLGIHALARYKAIQNVSDSLGRDITYNTLTRIDKLSENLSLGAYASWLESMGSEKRALTGEEEFIAEEFSRALRGQYGARRRFSGRDDAYNTIEGLPHGGLGQVLRRQLSEFGSGWLGYGAPIAMGIAASMMSGDISSGLSVYSGAGAGASLGYLRGGMKGGLVGAAIGGIALAGADWAGKELVGGIGGAVVAGVALSAGSSMKAVGQMKGGLLYSTQKAIFEKTAKLSGIKPADIEDYSVAMLGHNPLTDAAGFSKSVSRAALSQINWARGITQSSNHTLVKGIDKILSGTENVIHHPRANSLLDASFGAPRLQKLAREHGGINRAPGLAGALSFDILEGLPVGMAGAAMASYFDGMSHGGIASELRKRNTDFGSPVNLQRAVARAAQMYTKRGKKLLSEPTDWVIKTLEEEGGYSLQVLGKSKSGEELINIERSFRHAEIELSSIEIHQRLRGGMGRKFYESELDIFRKIGYDPGETVVSPVVSPITARLQMDIYKSKIIYDNDLTRTTDELTRALWNKEISLEDMPPVIMQGYIPRTQNFIQKTIGRLFKRDPRTPSLSNTVSTSNSISSGSDDSHNTIEGLNHKGIAQQLRKKNSPFGSGWDSLRNFTKVGEKFEDLLKSSEFKEALAGAVQGQQLGKGGFGAAHKMTGTFRGQEFSFIRKTGLIGEHEVSMMRKYQDSFAPTVYSDAKFVGSGDGPMGSNTSFYSIDMELFEGAEFKTLFREKAIPQEAFDKYSDALRQIKDAGLVHGDAHGGNVFLTPEGNVGFIDFGLSGPVGKPFGVLQEKGPQELQVVKPGGRIGGELDRRRLGHNIGSEYGFFIHRDEVLDEVAISAMMAGVSGAKSIPYLPPSQLKSVNELPAARATPQSKQSGVDMAALSFAMMEDNSSAVFASMSNKSLSSPNHSYGVFTNTPPSSAVRSKRLQSNLQRHANMQLTKNDRHAGKRSRM